MAKSALIIERALLFLLASVIVTSQSNSFDRSQQSIDDSSLLSEAFVAVGSANDGRLWDYSKGSTSATKLYASASTIKWITSVVLLRLVHEGTMSLDDSPDHYLSYWKEEDNGVTLRMLLSFTSGLHGKPLELPELFCVYLTPSSNIDGCAETLYGEKDLLVDDPGTTYYYGPTHLLVAASMAQTATGQPWHEIFESRVGQVLGMSSTSYKNTPNVAGGAEINGNDLEAFLRTMLRRDPDFLSTELWEEMLKDQTATVSFSNTPVSDYPFHYGLGVWRECLADEFDASCESVKVVSATGAKGMSGWVDYENGIYGLLMTELDGTRAGEKVISYSIEDLRPKILLDLSGATPAPAPSPSRKFCFSGQNVVVVQDRGKVAMRDLLVGDLVQTKHGVFEPVYSFGHFDQYTPVEFLQLYFSDQTEPLELTWDHLVFVNDSRSSSVITSPASTIRVGDVLLSSIYGKSLVVERIGSIVRQGFYAPVTESGVIDVNGVLASNYVTFQKDHGFLTIWGYETRVSSHWLAHVVFAPYRMLCRHSLTRNLCKIGGNTQSDTPEPLRYPMLLARWIATSLNDAEL